VWREGRGFVYSNRFVLGNILRLQRMAGTIAPAEEERWINWLRVGRVQGLAVDSLDHPQDPAPSRVAVLHELYGAARHPRSFVKGIIFDGA
jgi:hypothetical protein